MTLEYAQSDLFSLQGIPRWLPDETLFSLCSRYHELSGNLLASSTGHQLFGHGRQGTGHDFPSRLVEFAERTRGLLGSAEEIIRSRTLLPFYLPFRSVDDEMNAIAAMCRGGIGSLKFQLGILTSRFGANHPLRACMECMREDVQTHSRAYWHLSHQYPGVWVCSRHTLPLMVSTEKSTGVGRFLWLLPAENIMRPILSGATNTVVDPSLMRGLAAVAHNANRLAQLPAGFHFDPQVLLRTYHAVLLKRGLSTSQGSLKNAAIGNAYFEDLKPLMEIPDLVSLPKDGVQASTQVLRLLRVPRSGTHPLRHLLLIHWLFQDWEDFWRSYQQAELTNGQSNEKNEKTIVGEGSLIGPKVYADLVLSFEENNFSVRKAATQAGIDVSTAMARLAKAGISTNRRPKKLKAAIREQLLADLKCGIDKKLAADKYSISESTVMKTLRLEIGLYDAWISARQETAKKAARTEWQKLCDANPDGGVKQIRTKGSRIYAWLYRNDHAWLTQACSRLAKASHQGQNSVDWHLRDVLLSEAVQRAGVQLVNESRDKKIMLWRLYQKLPELKAKLSRLDRLPLTRKAIDDVIAMDHSANRPADLF